MALEGTNTEKLKRDALSLLRVGWSVDRIAHHFTSYREDYGTGLSFGSIRAEIMKLQSSKDECPILETQPAASIELSMANAVSETEATDVKIKQQNTEFPLKQIGTDEFLARFKPTAFFHFTDTRNLPSIKKHGLCSLSEIENKNIHVAAFGGDERSREIDRFKGLHRFVHLCFHNFHDLEIKAKVYDKRIKESVFISVSPEILRLNGVIFTPAVAYKKGCPLLTLNQAVQVMDFSVIYDGLDKYDPEINDRREVTRKYEILVPVSIPPKFLTFPNHG